MGKATLLVLLAFLAVTATAMNLKSAKKCRALVLEGGGDLGAYQVGVLKTFVEMLPSEEVMYDVVTGVSVGSINGMSVALHEIGKEKEAVDWMYDMWSNITSDDIYGNWWGGPVEGLFFKEGLWDNSQEVSFLSKTFDNFEARKVYRKVNLNTIDFDTGDVIRYKEDTPFEKLSRAVVASTSMPFAFPHTHMDNKTYVDGGTVWNIDLSGAIERCMEIVDDEKDIIIDTILCNSAQNVTRDDHKNYNTVNNFLRYYSLRGYYGTMSDYYEIMRGYPDINFRYMLVPQQDLPGGFLPLGFKHDQIMKVIKIGEEEAKKAIEGGNNNGLDNLREHLKRTMFHGLDIV